MFFISYLFRIKIICVFKYLFVFKGRLVIVITVLFIYLSYFVFYCLVLVVGPKVLYLFLGPFLQARNLNCQAQFCLRGIGSTPHRPAC